MWENFYRNSNCWQSHSKPYHHRCRYQVLVTQGFEFFWRAGFQNWKRAMGFPQPSLLYPPKSVSKQFRIGGIHGKHEPHGRPQVFSLGFGELAPIQSHAVPRACKENCSIRFRESLLSFVRRFHKWSWIVFHLFMKNFVHYRILLWIWVGEIGMPGWVFYRDQVKFWMVQQIWILL